MSKWAFRNTLTIDNGLVVNSGAGAVTISSTTVGLGFSQVWSNNSANSFTVSSSISGSGISLTLGGTGTTTLSGTSTYDGGTTVNGGTLMLGNPTDTLANGGAVTLSNATLDVSGQIRVLAQMEKLQSEEVAQIPMYYQPIVTLASGVFTS